MTLYLYAAKGQLVMFQKKGKEESAWGGRYKRKETPLLRGVGGVFSRRKIIWYNPELKELARQLRNNSTKSEIILWKQLKGKFDGKYDFHRQKPLDNYIADFFCYELRLVIEVDGETHNHPDIRKRDIEKECRLRQLGLYIIRFSDADVLQHLEFTVDTIRRFAESFEKNDFTSFEYEGTPLNPLSSSFFTHP